VSEFLDLVVIERLCKNISDHVVNDSMFMSNDFTDEVKMSVDVFCPHMKSGVS
jgi:hypothetical protein